MSKGEIVFLSIVCAILLIMLAPVIIIFILSFSGSEFLTFPPESFSLRWYIQFFTNNKFLSATWFSLILALVSTVIVLFLCIPASFSIKRYEFFGKKSVEIFLLSPLFVPRILLSVALLILFVKLKIMGSFTGLVIAHVIILIPYAIRLLLVGFYGISLSTEEAARCLGATPLTVFFKVTLPLLKSGLIGAAVFSFIVSFTDVLFSLFLCGPETVTLQLLIFNYLEWNHDPFIAAIGVVQTVAIIGGAVVLDRLVGLEKLF